MASSMVLSIQKDSQRFFTFGYYLSNSFCCKFGIKYYNKKNEIRGYMEDKDKIQQLFQNDKLLVRAMDDPDLLRLGRIGPKMSRDFTVWAKEVDASLHDGLICASSTLLVANESIPTYKSIGFIINSDQAEIVHVSDMDSGSCGSTKNGDFSACASELSTLAELADKTRKEKLTEMNEVNINIKNDAIIGLFFSKSDRPKAQVLLAQEYYKMHTGKELPIFMYDPDKGTLEALEISAAEKKEFLLAMKPYLKTLTIGYYLDSDYTQEEKQKTLYENGHDFPESRSLLQQPKCTLPRHDLPKT